MAPALAVLGVWLWTRQQAQKIVPLANPAWNMATVSAREEETASEASDDMEADVSMVAGVALHQSLK